APAWLFTHDGAFFSNDSTLAKLPNGKLDGSGAIWLPGPTGTHASWQRPECLMARRRQCGRARPTEIRTLTDSSADFLARQVQKSGRFIFGHFPCFGRTVSSYDALRHAQAVYSMLDAWKHTRDETLLRAIRNALDYLVRSLIRKYP